MIDIRLAYFNEFRIHRIKFEDNWFLFKQECDVLIERSENILTKIYYHYFLSKVSKTKHHSEPHFVT